MCFDGILAHLTSLHFSEYLSQPQRVSTSNYTNPLDDDDWGEFMNHSNQINSKPFNSFGVPTDPTNKHVNDEKGVVVQPEAAKNPKGAILLSIFGEEEGKEEEKPVSANVFSNGDAGAMKRGSSSNRSVRISDLISSLYNQQRPQVDSHNNESVSVSNVAAPNLMYSNGSKLNSDEDEDGWEFKSAERIYDLKLKYIKELFTWAETPKHDNGALDVDHINPQPSSESESNDIGTGFAMFSQNFGEFSSRSGPNQNLIIEECPLTQSDHGFVDFVSPYFHQFHIHSVHLGAKIHSHNFPYANLQFSDIYQEEHFINYLTPDIRIVRELPKELQSLDLEAISSVVSNTLVPQAEILEKINMEAKMAELSNLVRENSTKKDHTQTNNQVPPGEYRLSAIAATLENGVGLKFAPSYIDVVGGIKIRILYRHRATPKSVLELMDVKDAL
ncbi:hypothetical protein JHK82_027943 [Glycine max]|nr:hypothetical protein JHK82_027943 [Glycine max]